MVGYARLHVAGPHARGELPELARDVAALEVGQALLRAEQVPGQLLREAGLRLIDDALELLVPVVVAPAHRPRAPDPLTLELPVGLLHDDLVLQVPGYRRAPNRHAQSPSRTRGAPCPSACSGRTEANSLGRPSLARSPWSRDRFSVRTSPGTCRMPPPAAFGRSARSRASGLP